LTLLTGFTLVDGRGRIKRATSKTNMTNQWIASWVAVGCLLAGIPARGAEELTLGTQKQLRAEIVLDARLDAAVRDDLVRILGAMTHSTVTVSDRPAKGLALVAGLSDFEPFKGRYHPPRDEQSFQIARAGKQLHLVGATPTAATFAIYTFLEDLGCRWFMPGTLGEVIPRNSPIVWRGKSRTETPSFSWRQLWYAYGGPPETAHDFEVWQLRNKAVSPDVAHRHNCLATVPPTTYFKTHPEYYALLNGQRRDDKQLCTSNPDVVRLSIEHINEYFDKNPRAMSYSLCPDDNADFCECPNCTALDTGKKDKEGRSIVTDRVITYANAVARGIQQKHPGRSISTYAYLNYSTPPEREQIDTHVNIVFTASVYCSGHGIGDPACPSRRTMKEDLTGWTRRSRHVYVYEYDPTPFNAELPWPMYGTHTRSMPIYREMGIQGFTHECHDSWATLFPDMYVAARMMWDAGQSGDALMDDLCARFFGPAGPFMRTYYRELDEALRQYSGRMEWGTADYPQIFSPDRIQRCHQAMAAAQKAAQTPEEKARLQVFGMGFEYLENYLRCHWGSAAEMTREDFNQAWKRCEKLIENLHTMNVDYILAPIAERYFKTSLMGSLTPESAAALGLNGTWMLIGPFDNANGIGHDHIYPPEQETDFTKTYPGKEGQTARWQPTRRGDSGTAIDLASYIQPKDDTTAYAACYVTVPEARPVQIRLGSNDWAKLWVNGALVFNSHPAQGRPVILDEDVLTVNLPAGTSRLLLKVSNLAKSWGFCLRVTDLNGNLMKDVRFDTKP